MNSFAEELQELIERWEGFIGTTREDIVNDLMDAIEKLEPDVGD